MSSELKQNQDENEGPWKVMLLCKKIVSNWWKLSCLAFSLLWASTAVDEYKHNIGALGF